LTSGKREVLILRTRGTLAAIRSPQKVNIMHGIWIAVALAVSLAGCAQTSSSGSQDAKPLRIVSEQTVKGFAFPESVGYDPQGRVL
jgi:hypothetical protein